MFGFLRHVRPAPQNFKAAVVPRDAAAAAAAAAAAKVSIKDFQGEQNLVVAGLCGRDQDKGVEKRENLQTLGGGR